LTDNLTLRGLTVDDAADILEIHSNEQVMRYFGVLPQRTLEEAKAWIRAYFKNTSAGRWGILRGGVPKIIGTIGYHAWNQAHRRIEVGYALSPIHWRQGIMSEALLAVVQFAYEAMEVHRIQALVEPRNIASRKLLEKFGFQQEGLLRGFELAANNPCDLLLFALLRSDYVSSKQMAVGE
jgi:ribosomal-protein-alanine N-acetyltransferase